MNFIKKAGFTLATLGLINFTLVDLAFSAQNKKQSAMALESIYSNILQKDAKNAKQSCLVLQQKIHKITPNTKNLAILPEFTNLIEDWKKVQTLYIADELNGDAIDIPFYIDIFHTTNENIYEQIARAVKSKSKPDAALFKNSYKTLNALEAVLFQEEILSQRKIDLAKVQLENICSHLADIEQIYRAEKTKFLTLKDNKSTALLLNVIAKTSFMLKDWRLGDPAGLTRKYQGKPKFSRSEYPLSRVSTQAIYAILQAHNELIGKQEFANFVQLMQAYDKKASKVLISTQNYLTKSLQLAEQINNASFDFSPKKTQALYREVANLHNSYYIALMQSLPVVVKILEADGD